jgi:hypothetical protein
MGKTRKAIQWLSFAIRALDCHGRVNKRLAGAPPDAIGARKG